MPGVPQSTPPAHTGLLLQPLLLQHCSPLRGSLPLPTRVHKLGGNGASLDSGPASDQQGGSHCQHMPSDCMQLEGNEANSRAETTIVIACIPVYTWDGIRLAQGCDTNPSSPNTGSNQGAYPRGKMKPTQKYSPKPQAQATSQTKAKTTITPGRNLDSSKLLLQPHGPCPSP